MQQKKVLTTLFNPQSIAVLGASRDEQKIGHIVLKNIIDSGFPGSLFAINPNASEILGVRCFPDFSSLSTVPDLAIISVPAQTAVMLLEEIGHKGTKNIVLFSAGFKEVGAAGAELERELQAAAKKYGLRILGPNCLGFASTLRNINATFSRVENRPGNLRFMSQSGALASGIFDWAQENSMGFSEFITLGNKSIIDENDILQYWLEQKSVVQNEAGLSKYQPIGMYLESINNGSEFIRVAKQITRQNPVFLLKPGRSQHAQQAIRSHTGSLAGDDAVIDVACAQAGIIRCDGVEDMFDLAKVFSWENAPEGSAVAIVSNAGGPAVISTDMVEKEGMVLAQLSAVTHQKLEKTLPRAANILNPVDVLGDALSDRFREAVNDVLAEKQVNAVVVIVTPQIMTEIEATAKLIGELSAKYNKPIVCSFMGGSSIAVGERVLNAYKIPSFRFPERAVKALAAMWRWRQFAMRQSQADRIKTTTPIFARPKIQKIKNLIAASTGTTILSLSESDFILKTAGIKVPQSHIVDTYAEALRAARACGWPVVLKISSPALIHKTETKAVIAHIYTEKDLAASWKQIQASAKKIPDGAPFLIYVQKQVQTGLEVIVGLKYDKNFGNVFLVGSGGVTAELFKDIQMTIGPIDRRRALEVIKKTKIYQLLIGFRGHTSYALQKLIDLMVQLYWLSESVSDFSEITINPVIVTEKEAWAVDPRIIINRSYETVDV